MQQYVKGISETGMQSKYGFDGQINACWLHKITKPEIEVIRSAGFLVSVIHGRYATPTQLESKSPCALSLEFVDLVKHLYLYTVVNLTMCWVICRHDVIAQICYARRLAQRLYPVARMVDLHGGHLVSHERTEEVLLSNITSLSLLRLMYIRLNI